MKSPLFQRTTGAAVLSWFLVLAGAAQSRAALTYTLTLNVASLVGNSHGPFSLDVDLNSGATNPNSDNTVTLSNFVVTGGSLGSTPTFFNGGESGSLGSSVTLTASSFDNELAQAITGNVTQISFNLTESAVTDNPDPDTFDVAIFDNGQVNIPTTDPSGADTLLLTTLGTTETLSSVHTFNSTAGGEAPGVTASVAAAVPEPASTASMLAGLGVLAIFGRKALRRRAKA